MKAKIISIATHKGGTGKTVTAMGLAAALANSGIRTLLIDLDPQGHSTIGLGVELTENAYTVKDIFSQSSISITKVVRKSHLEKLDILPSNIGLEKATYFLYMKPRREELLKKALQPLLPEYEYVLIDCPPSLGVLTETAISAADLILVPCQMEARAGDGLVDLLDVVNVIKGDEFDNWKIVLTKFDNRKSVTNQAIMGALSSWKEKILKSSIPQSEPLNQAQIERTDIFSFDSKSKGALAYQALKDEVLEYVR